MMKRYRPDPANPPRLTDEQARRLDEAPIDYSDIPPLDDEFFAKARRMTEIDWTKCADVESVPGRCSGAWVVKDSRVIVETCILGNAEDCTPEEIADMFEVPVTVVCRVLRFAYRAELRSLTHARRQWPNLPADYQTRADELTHKLTQLNRARRPRPTRKPLP